MRAALFCLTLMACALVAKADGQRSPNHPWLLSQWQRRVWQIEDGLPHNYVTAVTQDHLGRLLVGTKDGIVTFDGFAFQRYHALTDNWIYSLLMGADGTLWVGTYEQGLYSVKDNQVTKVADGSFYTLKQGADGRVWSVSATGLGFVEDRRFRLLVPGKNTEGYGWQSASQADDGTMWFVAQSGVYRVQANGVARVHIQGLKGLPVTIYSLPKPSRILVGTKTGLYRLECRSTSCSAVHVKGVPGPVVGLHETLDHTLWIGTWGRGLYRVSIMRGKDRVEKLDYANGLPDDFVHAVYEDTEHNLWIGTRGGGLTRLRTTVLMPVGIPEGVDGNCASAAAGDGTGTVWLGTWRSGLFRWRDGEATRQRLPGSLSSSLITSLAIDSDRNLWIGSFDGLYVLRRGRETAQKVRPFPSIASGDTVRQMLTALDGSLYLVTEGGHLAQFPTGNPEVSEARSILPRERVTYIMQSHTGTIWIGTASGLWQMKTGHSVPIHTYPYNSPVMSISEDRQSRLWTSNEDGSIRVHRGDRVFPFPDSAFPSRLIYRIVQDADNNVWFSTGLGLVRVSKRDVDALLANPAAHFDAVEFGIADGARTVECRCADHPQSWVAPDGVMWIPTAKGFVQANPRRVGSMPPPRVSVEDIHWDGTRAVQTFPAHLEAGAHAIEIHFSAVRLGMPRQVRFRYRLEGVDLNWIETGNDKIARYSKIPPGAHRFLVEARDSIGSWSPSAMADLDQRPYVYQTLLFKGFMGALTLLLASTVYLIHLRNVRARYAAVLNERTHIAREWHDTLLAGLAAVSLQLDVTIRKCTQEAVLTSLTRVRGMLRYCSDEARRAVSDLRDETLSPPDIEETLRDGLRQMIAGTDIHYTLTIASSLPRLPSDTILHLSRICQEAASNAIQHGKASELLVAIEHVANEVNLVIQDNGIGIDPLFLSKPRPGHFGIMGMRERAERMGGRLEISQVASHGTLVRVTFPFPT